MRRALEIRGEVSLRYLDEKLLPHTLESHTEYIIDLSKLSNLYATSAVNLLIFVAYLREFKQYRIIIVPPTSEKANEFLSNMRFYLFAQHHYCIIHNLHTVPPPASPLEMAERHRILEIRPIPQYDFKEEFYAKFTDSLERTIVDKLSNMSGSINKLIPGVILELAWNVYQHSRSFGYISAQIISSNLHVTIGDLGIGIVEALEPIHKDILFERRFGPLWDEVKAIDVAFIAGVSSKRPLTDAKADSPHLNKSKSRIGYRVEPMSMGNGLEFILDTIKKSHGSIVCRSGTSKLFAGYQGEQWKTGFKRGLVYMPGTQLEIQISLR